MKKIYSIKYDKKKEKYQSVTIKKMLIPKTKYLVLFKIRFLYANPIAFQ